MVVDFVSLIERFGHIPNGTRTYYVSRSQPPFFALMLDIAPGGTPLGRKLKGLRAQANDYLRQFLKDGIMQLYKEAYANPDLDDNARSTIRREARNRMGQDPAANAIVTARFTEYMNTLANPPAEAEPAEGEERERGRGRRDPAASARDSARGYLESLAQPRDRSPESVAGRKALLGSWRATTSDAQVITMMDKVDERLTALSDPEKAKNLRGFSLREGRGGRGEGFSWERLVFSSAGSANLGEPKGSQVRLSANPEEPLRTQRFAGEPISQGSPEPYKFPSKSLSILLFLSDLIKPPLIEPM